MLSSWVCTHYSVFNPEKLGFAINGMNKISGILLDGLYYV